MEAGILTAVGRRVHAALERIYALPVPEAGVLQSDPSAPAAQNATARAQAIATLFAAMQREFERSRTHRGLLRSEPEATFMSSVAYLNDADLAEMERIRGWLLDLRTRPAEAKHKTDAGRVSSRSSTSRSRATSRSRNGRNESHADQAP